MHTSVVILVIVRARCEFVSGLIVILLSDIELIQHTHTHFYRNDTYVETAKL